MVYKAYDFGTSMPSKSKEESIPSLEQTAQVVIESAAAQFNC
jgi:hypothetical protein